MPLLRSTRTAASRVASAVGLRGLAVDARWLFLKRLKQRGLLFALRTVAARHVARRRLRKALESVSASEVSVRPPQALHPLSIRRASSDPLVYQQIFVGEEYGPLDTGETNGLVIDCGANVGYSSAWFLSRYPQCSVIAIEPDFDNFRMLNKNLQAFGSRARAINAGVWSEAGFLRIAADRYRDGREWSRQVSLCAAHEGGAFPAVDIPSLLAIAGTSRIALLKVDIEGAEAVLFGPRSAEWISAVDRIAIELHDDTHFGDCRGIFFEAIAGQGFAVTTSGELTLCVRDVQL